MGQTTERVVIIRGLIESGLSANEIAQETNCHVQNVYGVARRYGLRIAKRQKHGARDAEIKRLRESGHNYKQIAETIGADKHTVRDACKRMHCELTDVERKEIRRKAGAESAVNRYDDDQVYRLIQATNKGVEYVGGYTNNKGTVKVKCLYCGEISERSYLSIVDERHGAIICNGCTKKRRAEREAEKEQRREEREQERERKHKEAERERERKRAERWHDCPVCGKRTDRAKYCSDKCSRRAENKRRETRKRMRYGGGDNITIEALARRNNNTCYICGLAVNWNDYEIRNGAFIVGGMYPSIDHIKPISHGGTNTWDNVGLAHMRCNSVKSNRLDFVS